MRLIPLALLSLAAYATAGTFYFLPPNDPDWIKKTPHLICMDNGIITAMGLEPTACGWYKATINNSDACEYIIWQGTLKSFGDIINNPTDKIGLNGLDEGPADWDDLNLPIPIIFNTLFSQYGNNLYFDAKNGWSSTMPLYDPTQANRCNYTMAGIIYDTDQSLLSSFNDVTTGSSLGIRKGIVKPTLVKNSKNISKMQFNQSKNGWSEADFNQAFNCTGGKNAMVCYDIPFKRDSKALWTFDSDYLCKDGTVDLGKTDVATRCANNQQPTYGFFPDVLNEKRNPNTSLDPSCSYANCPSCANTAQAESWVPLNNSISRTCYEYSLSGTSTTKAGCGTTPFGEGDFSDGNTPAVWDWGSSRPSLPNKNKYFCFETHANFTYEKGQEFYFSGDDDIWVFINNNLVIDLGGSHLAAPGYVALDSIGRSGRWQGPSQVSSLSGPDYTPLVEGNEYPLDIFFCDRRRTMSNIRISTNMYISQQNALFVKEGNGTTTPARVCMTHEGGNCAAFLGSGTQELCGSAVAQDIEYYIINRKGDEMRFLGSYDPDCMISANPSEFVCYGGIVVNRANGTARVDKGKIVGLPGTWYLYAKVTDAKAATMNPPPADVKIAQFSAEVNIKMVYGTIRRSNGTLITNICKGPQAGPVVTGELKPVCFSTGNNIDPEEVGGSVFSLNPAGLTINGSKLKVYLDSTGKTPVNRLDTVFTIPGRNATTGAIGAPPIQNSGSVNGVLVLWITGDYRQNEQNIEYKINVRGRPATEEVTLTSIVPELRWVKSDGTIIQNQNRYGSKFDANGNVVRGWDGKLEPAWIREPIKLNMRAFNPINNATCKTCNFMLSYSAEAKNASGQILVQKTRNLVDVSGLAIVKGEANIVIAGKVGLTDYSDPYYATVTINGSSTVQSASWDSLQFRAPPVPIPDNTKLYDSNGDGIGDSLVITYSRGFSRDSLPNMIEVFWDKDTTIRYGTGTSANNYQYWQQYLRLDAISPNLEARNSLAPAAINALRDTIKLVLDSAGRQRARFSRKVLTQGEGSISSWASFAVEKTPGGGKVPYDLNFMNNIDEKIPAIVIAANYVPGSEVGCGTNIVMTCMDRLTIEFSEPVFADANVSYDEAKNPFAYMLRDIGEKEFKILSPASLANVMVMRFGSSYNWSPSENGDSIVYLTFSRWRNAGSSSGTPMLGDSVKFAVKGKYGLAKNLLVDINGNPPNPNEIGRQIKRGAKTPQDICEDGGGVWENSRCSTKILAQTASGRNILVSTMGNAIILQNLPRGAKVGVYNLQGKRIYSANSVNSQILKIPVQTKGMYIIKAGNQTMRVVVR